jgi:hypothetical protein
LPYASGSEHASRVFPGRSLKLAAFAAFAGPLDLLTLSRRGSPLLTPQNSSRL